MTAPRALLDSSGKKTHVTKGESADIVVTFQDMAGDQIAKASLASLTATLFDADSSSVINSRNGQNVLDANSGTVASDGTLTLRLGPSDNVIVGNVDVGDVERHTLRLAWAWSDGVATRTGIEQWSIYVEATDSPS